jgi:hypothetical protein
MSPEASDENGLLVVEVFEVDSEELVEEDAKIAPVDENTDVDEDGVVIPVEMDCCPIA